MVDFDLKDHLKAEVLDIRQPDCPVDESEKLLIDTNVLYFTFYERSNQLVAFNEAPQDYQTSIYEPFLKQLLNKGLFVCVHKVGLLEFVKTVEIAELKIMHNRLYGTLDGFKYKSLRREHIEEYRIIQNRIAIYVYSIRKSFTLIDINIPIKQFTDTLMFDWKDTLADVADSIMVSEAKHENVTSILSDDSDIATITGIKLYTANDFTISACVGN